MAAEILEGLNSQQQSAVEAVRGPVCILAGAGSGKTTTITHRIAYQVKTGAFEPSQILAVTFTDKAASEMRSRLAALDTPGVRARTFHAAALAQLHHLAVEPPGEILASKGLALRQLANRLPKPYRFRPAADLASEVEWAKNQRIGPADYLDRLGGHQPPVPPDLMSGLYAAYERGKRARGVVDFEDVLELAVTMFEQEPDALDRFQARYASFTVDEYQDVNLLQQTLLDCWLGQGDDVCVVGDDYQSIYAFTGASPEYLLGMPDRFPRTRVFRLELNYRSTPEVLGIANRLVPRLGGAEKVLRAVRSSGPRPRMELATDALDEARTVARVIAELHERGVCHEDMAILYRVNYRSEDFEEALAAAGIPYQVKGAAFLARPAARRMLRLMAGQRSTDVAAVVERLARAHGYAEDLPDGIGDAEMTRQSDLGRLVSLAQEFDDGAGSVADFAADLAARFGTEGTTGRGVNLLTYHRSKGLEFEAVFLPRLIEGELPFRRSTSPEALAEERRLFYVGITRAKSHLVLSRPTSSQPSRFLEELGWTRPAPPDQESPEVLRALRTWRAERARSDRVPAYVVFHDSTLVEIARRRPLTERQLAAISGIGPIKLERYGAAIISVLRTAVSR